MRPAKRPGRTDEEEKPGLEYRLTDRRDAVAYACHSYLGRNERGREDGNVTRLSPHGFGLAADYRSRSRQFRSLAEKNYRLAAAPVSVDHSTRMLSRIL
ncbi:MAG: hypothetical protein ACYCZD_13445 [Rhodanobacter sp.]